MAVDHAKCKEIVENFKHGDSFTAKISGDYVSGKISIKLEMNIPHVYLCYNEEGHDGDRAPDRLGYRRSWVIDQRVTELVITPATRVPEIINNYQIF